MISLTEDLRSSQYVTQYGYAVLDTEGQKGFATENLPFLGLFVPFHVHLGVFMCFLRQVSTSRVAEEDEAPDTGGGADDQAHGQHGTVRHLPAQPAHKEEAQDDLHPTQAVHQAVTQLTETEVALRQRCHHGLRIFRKMFTRSVSYTK